jgi:cell division protein ZapB
MVALPTSHTCHSGASDVITPGGAGEPRGKCATGMPAGGISIDRYYTRNYSVAMDSLEQTAKDLQRLERQLHTLLEQTQKLREENRSLQVRQESLVAERAALVAKNDEARTKVEAMIHRLKALEQA